MCADSSLSFMAESSELEKRCCGWVIGDGLCVVLRLAQDDICVGCSGWCLGIWLVGVQVLRTASRS